MNTLSIEDATRFYNIVLPYLPEGEVDEIVPFAGKIIDNIVNAEQHEDYLELVKMITDLEEDELEELGGVKVLELFIEGIIENRVPFMKDYFDKVGFGHD